MKAKETAKKRASSPGNTSKHRRLRARAHLATKKVLEAEAAAKTARAQIAEINAELVMLGAQEQPSW